MVRIGIVGVGGIADGVHIPQINNSNGGRVVAICDIDKKRLNDIGEKYAIAEEYRFENYIDLINCDIVDAVEICTPNYLHVKIAEEVIKAGKAVNIEKPLSTDMKATKSLTEILKTVDAKTMMCFSYRFFPAVRYAKEIMNKNLLGDIISVNVEYLKSSAFMEGRRLDWRFVKEYAGTGVLGDLGVHLIDMAHFLLGDIKDVCAKTGIVVKKRQRLDSDEWADVETDDYCNFIANFERGATGLFNITRCAIGHTNTIKYDIYGTKGVISFNLNNPDVLDICIGEIDVESFGMHTVKVPDKYKITQEQMFIDMVSGKECKYIPTVYDGIKCQQVLEAILKSSEENKWVNV